LQSIHWLKKANKILEIIMSLFEKLKTETKGKKLPAIWEAGGGATKTGRSFIITNLAAAKLEPVFVRHHGHIVNDMHALFILKEDTICIDCFMKDGKVAKIQMLNYEGTVIAEYETGVWTNMGFDNEVDIPLHFSGPIDAAIAKASDYHCKKMTWGIEPYRPITQIR
jgi:hypothetical protein